MEVKENQPKANTKAQTWICTWNNPDKTDKEFFDGLKTVEGIKYFIGQREKGEECGTEHIQFYIEFEYARHFKTVQKCLPHGTHIEQRKGTKTQARVYCSKAETRIGEVYEYGEFVEQGQRNDLVELLAMVDSGATLAEIRKAYPSQVFIFHKKIVAARSLYLIEKFGDMFRNIKVTYIHGQTAVGKTRTIAEKFGYKNIYRVTEYDQRAFDCYDGQDIVVLEEFRSSFKISQMLNYLDGHPVQLPCRYEDKPACFTQLFILTNLALHQQYTEVQNTYPETWQALMRRIQNVYNFDNTFEKQKFINGEPNPNPLDNTCKQTGMRILTPEEAEGLPW